MVKEWQNPETLKSWLVGASAKVSADDARVLLTETLGISLTQLYLDPDRKIPQDWLEALSLRLERRIQGEPVAYIVGRQGFWSLELEVNRHTLIPRADTETIVSAALDGLKTIRGPSVLDLGTGSGAIALAIAHERKDAHVIATDSSEDALDVARRNADRLGIRNVEFRYGSWFEAVEPGMQFDAIVSNPPYIRENDPHLDALGFEPITALTSGLDGLNDIRSIVTASRDHLTQGGSLLIEHGFDQGAQVRELLRDFSNVRTLTDFGGNERVTIGQM